MADSGNRTASFRKKLAESKFAAGLSSSNDFKSSTYLENVHQLRSISEIVDLKRSAFLDTDESAFSSTTKPSRLCMYPSESAEDEYGISVYYAPFDSLNINARVVLVGITPGKSQMQRAWAAARLAMRRGTDIASAISEVKRISSFNDEKNQMRPNLYAQLEHWGVDRWLGLSSGASLFDEGWGQVQTTSLLQFPTFLKDENYEGKSPPMLKHGFLRSLIFERLVPDLRKISDALLLPLGVTVEKVIRKLISDGHIKNQCVYGMLHPSGNNTYRRIYLCGDRKGPAPHATSVAVYDAGRREFLARFLKDSR